jgi:hypothetical protein
MRTVAAFTAALGVLIIALGASALAVEAQRPGRTAATPTRAKAMPLSNGECTQLGGTIIKEPLCQGSGQKCKTVDQYGIPHNVCITTTAP